MVQSTTGNIFRRNALPSIATFGNDYSGYSSYLRPTSNCQSSNATIISVAKTGMNYGSTPTTTYTAMYNLMNYLNDHIAYDYYYDTYYGAVSTRNNRIGTLLELCKALSAYSDSAKAYFSE